MRRRHPTIELRSIVGGGLTSLVGAIVAGLVAAGVLSLGLAPDGLARVPSLIIELVLVSGAGLGVYLLYSRAVRVPELPRTIGLLRSALGR